MMSTSDASGEALQALWTELASVAMEIARLLCAERYDEAELAQLDARRDQLRGTIRTAVEPARRARADAVSGKPVRASCTAPMKPIPASSMMMPVVTTWDGSTPRSSAEAATAMSVASSPPATSGPATSAGPTSPATRESSPSGVCRGSSPRCCAPPCRTRRVRRREKLFSGRA